MPVKHALLGLLALKPRTGYDLHKRIERFSPLVEPISLRRIYPMLKRMADEGLVTCEVEPQEGKPAQGSTSRGRVSHRPQGHPR